MTMDEVYQEIQEIYLHIRNKNYGMAQHTIENLIRDMSRNR